MRSKSSKPALARKLMPGNAGWETKNGAPGLTGAETPDTIDGTVRGKT